MIIAAKILQKMSKFPYTRRYGNAYVKDRTHLHRALIYLQYGLTTAGPYDTKLTEMMASCLFDLNELVPAADWMKRSLTYTVNPNTHKLKLTCLYLLKRFSVERKMENKPLYLIKEIISVLQSCTERNLNIDEIYRFLMRNALSELRSLLEDTIVPSFLTHDGIVTVRKLLEYENSKGGKLLRGFLEKMDQVTPLQNSEFDLEDTFQVSPAQIPIPVSSCILSDKKKFDFFICHSKKDSDRVNEILLFELENKLTDDEIAFKGCFPERDFVEDKTIICNFMDAINDSYKLIVIITKNFLECAFCKYKMENALERHIRQEEGVIPVMFDSVDMPDCLNIFVPLDLTGIGTDIGDGIKKLKRALLQGDSATE